MKYTNQEFVEVDMVFDDEPTTVALMDAYLEKNGYVNGMNMERLHHEIYA